LDRDLREVDTGLVLTLKQPVKQAKDQNIGITLILIFYQTII